MHLLKSVRFVAGSNEHAPPLEVPVSRVLVLVGPNNAGKSLALRDFVNCLETANGGRVIGDVELNWPRTENEILDLLRPFEVRIPPESADPNKDQQIFISRPGTISRPQLGLTGISKDSPRRWLQQPKSGDVRGHVIRNHILNLDVRTRFRVLEAQQSTNLQNPPTGLLDTLFRDPDALRRLNESIGREFGLALLVDPSSMSQLEAKVIEGPLDLSAIADIRSTDALSIFRRARPLPDVGEGVQGYIGVLASAVFLPQKIVIIDEPEAFLHPALAFRLAGELNQLAVERDAQIVIATHSADFLMGCVQAGAETTIVRLTYTAGEATARALAAEDVRRLTRDPLIRSTNALAALFRTSVVVAEADADRVFYQEVNFRLRREGRGLPDALFLNAQNWQTIPRIVGPLRQLGIPAVGVMDLDVLVANQPWRDLYEAFGIIRDIQNRIGALREKVKSAGFVGRDLKEGGLDLISGVARVAADELIAILKDHGLFITPVGELERWLTHLNIRGPKTEWLLRILDALGADPSLEDYTTPTTTDVWQFLDEIGAWVAKPATGIPD